MALNSTRAYEYVFSTASLYSADISNGLYAACLRLGSSFFNTLSAAFTIIIYVLILTTKLTIMIIPHFLSTLRAVVEFHLTKLTYYDLLVEFSVVTLFVLFLLLRKRIINQWQIFVKSVARKSKAAAKAAPHVAFFTFAFLFSIAGRKFLVHLATPGVLPVITLLIPIYSTFNDLRCIRSNWGTDSISSTKVQKIQKQRLTLWVVLAAYHTLATGLSLIPFSTRMSSIMPLARVFSVVIIVWVQLSHSFANIVFDASVPFLKYLARNIPSSNFGASQGSSFVSMLKMMGLINAKYERLLKSLQRDLVLVLIAGAFMFCPWRISYIGVIIVSILLPAFQSSNSILELRGRSDSDGEKIFWLEYWICWGLMWCLQCYGFRIWPSVMLLTALWLQHSFFRGATWLLLACGSNWKAVMVRHDRMQKEKRLSIGGESSADECGDLVEFSESSSLLEEKPDKEAKEEKKREKGREKEEREVASRSPLILNKRLTKTTLLAVTEAEDKSDGKKSAKNEYVYIREKLRKPTHNDDVAEETRSGSSQDEKERNAIEEGKKKDI